VADGQPVDLLSDFGDCVAWLAQAGILNHENATQARARWEGTREAALAFEQARELRNVLGAAIKRLVEGKSMPRATVAAINVWLQQQSGHTEVVRVKGGYDKRFHTRLDAPMHLLVPIAESFADLLCYGDLSLIKKCANPMCVLYFYDTTKNHARRWCSMSVCGNRTKAAAHYRRKRLRE
jgi:predicted RNA-binding Zn ribbon-like protein